MSENRKQILDMLAQGKITADEADKLIAALGNEGNNGAAPGSAGWPKYLRVLIEAEDEDGGDSLTKVNVRIPFALLRAGVRLTSLIPPDAREHMNAALREKGVGIDINQLKPENLNELIEQLRDLTVDIDNPKKRAKVRVFCE